MAIDPRTFLGDQYDARIESLLGGIEADPAVRLPGAKRLTARAYAAVHGVSVARSLHERIAQLRTGSKVAGCVSVCAGNCDNPLEHDLRIAHTEQIDVARTTSGLHA